MRKIVLLALLFISTISFGQKKYFWVDAGLKAMYGGSSMLNQAAMDHPDLDYNLTFGNAYSVGGKIGFNKGFSGLAIELMYNSASHEFQYLKDGVAPEMEWKSYDAYFLFRNAQNLGFFEIGPKFSFLQEFRRIDQNGEFVDVADLADVGISGVLSFGVNVVGTDGSFSGQIGLRMEYGFTDMIAGASQDAGEPFYLGDVYEDGYEKSTPVFAGLVFELNWGIGYYGQTTCGGRAKFLRL